MNDDHRDGPIHQGDLAIGEADNPGMPDDGGLLVARFARYPGCQQLQVWLPQPGYQGYTRLQVTHATGRVLDQGLVTARLSGSVQLLFDTLGWPPGDIELVVERELGGSHRLRMHKFEGEQPRIEPEPIPPSSNVPIVYRDGFGRIIPDADLELRARAFETLVAEWPRWAADEPPDRDPIDR